MCRVVNLHKEKYDIYIGRPGKGQDSIWGNPFRTGPDGTREEVIEKFKQLLVRSIAEGYITIDMLLELDGKVLGCFCKPKSCHGDIIVEAVEWAKEYRRTNP